MSEGAGPGLRTVAAPDSGSVDGGADRRLPVLAVAALTLAVFGLHLFHSLRLGGPTVSFDETGYLGNARWLSGSPDRWEMPTSPTYAIGYPLVLAPLLALVDAVGAQWRAVTVVNSALLASMVPLGYHAVRTVFDAPRRAALVAAGVAAVVPASVAAAPSAIAENLVLPLLLCCVVSLVALIRPGATAGRVWFGPAVAALSITHPRFIGVVLLAAALLVVLLARRRLPVVVGLNLAALAVLVPALRALEARVWSSRWDHVERFGGPAEVLALLGSWDGVRELLLVGWGQAWYLAVGSLGLAVVGVVEWFRAARRPGTYRAVAVFVLFAAAVVFATSVGFFALVQFRADHLVYGRHNDSFTPLWVLPAVVALLGQTARSVRRTWSFAAGVVAVTAAVLLVARDPTVHGGVHAPFAVPALGLFHDSGGSRIWVLPSLVALVACLAVVAAARSPLARRVVLAVTVVALLGAGHRVVRATEEVEQLSYAGLEAPSLLRRVGVDSLAIDATAVDVATPVLTYGWLLPDLDVTTYDPGRGDRPTGDVVLARLDDESMRSAGARILTLDGSAFVELRGAPEGLAVFVLPGAEQDRLDAAGWLLPSGFPSPLPEAARVAELGVTDA